MIERYIRVVHWYEWVVQLTNSPRKKLKPVAIILSCVVDFRACALLLLFWTRRVWSFRVTSRGCTLLTTRFFFLEFECAYTRLRDAGAAKTAHGDDGSIVLLYDIAAPTLVGWDGGNEPDNNTFVAEKPSSTVHNQLSSKGGYHKSHQAATTKFPGRKSLFYFGTSCDYQIKKARASDEVPRSEDKEQKSFVSWSRCKGKPSLGSIKRFVETKNIELERKQKFESARLSYFWKSV